MAKKLYEESNISAIASAIRSKNGLSDTYTTSDMASAILSIDTAAPVLESLTVSVNGSYSPGTGVDGFSNVVVSVPGSAAVLESLTVSENGSYSPGTGVDGFSDVVVDVQAGLGEKFITTIGRTYFNTNVPANSVYGFVFEFSPSLSITNYEWYFGAKHNECVMAAMTSRNQGYIRLASIDFGVISFVVNSKNTIVVNNGIVTVNGRQLSTSFVGPVLNTSDNIKLLGTDYNAKLNCNGRMYTCKLFGSNGNLIHSYYPSVDLSGIACLYDSIEESYLYAISSTSVVFGYENASEPVLISSVFSQNGTYDAGLYSADGFNNIVVSVPSSAAVLASKTISQNGTYIALDDSCDGYDQVVVSVPSSGGDASGLLSIILGSTSGSVYDSNLDYLRSYAMYNNRCITEATFPACKLISEYAFYACSYVTLVSVPECKTIGTSAFAGCFVLETIAMPLCESIASWVFYSCYALKPMLLSVCKYIGHQAFGRCSALTYISLPVCSAISGSAFQSCIALSSIILLSNSVCSLFASNAFNNTPIASSGYLGYFGSIYVPESLVESYKSAPAWSYYSDRITAWTE